MAGKGEKALDGSFVLILMHLGLINVARRWRQSFRLQNAAASGGGSQPAFVLYSGCAPRQQFKDTVARHSYKVALLAAIAGQLELREFRRTDLDFTRLLHMALLHDVIESQTGTFDHAFKQMILPELRRVERLISEDLIRRLPEPLQPEYRDWIMSLGDGSVESRLVAELDDLEAALKCRREVRYGNTTYFEAQHAAICQKLRRSEFASVRRILADIESGGGLAQVWDAAERLDLELRWEGRVSFLTDDDASHSWRTAVIASYLANLDRHLRGVDVDVAEVVIRALLHDLHEAFTGDVLTSVKHMDARIHHAIARVEARVNQLLLERFPRSIRRQFRAGLLAPKEGREGEYIAMADTLDSLFKSAMELRYGNEAAYRRTFEQLQEKARRFPQPVMRDVLEHILPTFLRDDTDPCLP